MVLLPTSKSMLEDVKLRRKLTRMSLDALAQEDLETMIGTFLSFLKVGKLKKTEFSPTKAASMRRKSTEPKLKYLTKIPKNPLKNHFSLGSRMEELLKLPIMISISTLKSL